MEEKTKILMLGTYHFGNAPGHLIDSNPGDITNEKKQKEIMEVIEKLLLFKPNKIAVEAKKENEKELNDVYSQYCINNSYEFTQTISHRNEIVQLGFRIGQILKHDKIYPLDYPLSLPEEIFEYAQKNHPKLYNSFIHEVEEYGINENKFMKNSTVLEILRHLNNPERFSNEHSNLYLRLAQIGAGDTYCGVDMLTEWYRRNLYILANLQTISKPGDRILVIYGAGHCKILQSFIKDYHEFEFIDPLEYL